MCKLSSLAPYLGLALTFLQSSYSSFEVSLRINSLIIYQVKTE